MTNHVVTEVEGGRATLTLNRPEMRNPTSVALLDAMDRALDEIAAAPEVKVLVLAGAGKSFCSGLDLDETTADTATIHKLLTRLSEVMRRLRRLPLATIACVQGAAIGGGFGFMAVCDLRIAHAEAKIGYPPLRTGLSPALMSPWLIRLIGPSAARAMLMAGGTISGSAAHANGIVSHLVERDEISACADALAAELLTGPPHAMQAMKTLLNDLDGSMLDEPLDRAAAVSADVIAHRETQARLRELFGG